MYVHADMNHSSKHYLKQAKAIPHSLFPQMMLDHGRVGITLWQQVSFFPNSPGLPALFILPNTLFCNPQDFLLRLIISLQI